MVAGGTVGAESGTTPTTAETAPAAVAPVSTAPPPVPAAHRITAADQAKLAEYFESVRWPLNKLLPKETSGNMSQQIVVLYLSLGLKHSQTARYLAKWKNEYHLLGGQVRPNMPSDDVVERIMANISCTALDFVANAIKMMVEDASPADTEAEKYCKQFLTENPDWRPLLGSLILKADSHGVVSSLIQVFVEYFESIVRSLADLVPKKASCISKAELEYCRKLQQHRSDAVASWIEEWTTNNIPSAPDPDGLDWRPAAVSILYSIYSLFQISQANDDKPKIEFPNEILVSSYAFPVVYYSASFTVGRCKLCKSIKAEKKELYQSFASTHMLTKEEAKEANLPTSMVEQREIKGGGSFCRCSKGYFDFIQEIESVFLKNLTLKMMVAYDKGDLIVAIGDAVLSSDRLRSKFDDLAEEAGIDDEARSKELYQYVITLFTGMRGRWFIKTVRGQESTASIFSKAATRKKVANASDISKARAEGAAAEKEVYEEAERNVLENATDEADDEIEEALEDGNDED